MDTVRLTPSHLVVGGSALARGDDGRVVFVAGAIPGESVDVTFRTTKKDFATADVVSVVVASPDRVDPPCEAWHRGCGGCDWQHIEPSAQLRYKTEIVREALQRTARLDSPTVVAAGSVAPWSYRTTIRLAGRADGSVGFRSRRSHEIVPIENCPVADERINAVLAAGRIDGRQARRDDVMVRAGSDGDHVVVTGDGLGRDHAADDDRVFNTVAGHRFRVSPGSFFQSSAASAELLVEAVARACADIAIENATVVDAYGGVGLFGATVARRAAHLILVESSASSCADAAINLVGQPATIARSRMEHWSPQPADLVIADPARRGLDKGGSAMIAATGASAIVLVSCDVGSLARDIRLLQGYGYVHVGTQVLDVFPNTSHIEAVTRFEHIVGRASL
ncbi:MAG: hypothetical protein ABIR32_05015 [Ilumatobacteraceae bacterium]